MDEDIAPGEENAEAQRERREALRKAGQEYLERALQAASKGEDPFLTTTPSVPEAETGALNATPDPSVSSGRKGPRSRKQLPLDPDVAAFGRVFENSKVYVYAAIYVICQATIFAFIKGSLAAMKTPAVLSFLHMLSVSLSFWLSSGYDVFDLRMVTTNTQAALKGCCVRATLFGLQMLFLYGAILHSSVNMVLCWLMVGPPLMDALLGRAGLRHAPLGQDLGSAPLLAIAGGATALEALLDPRKTWLSLVLLACWSATKLAEAGWRAAKEDPTLGGWLDGYSPVALAIREAADCEDQLNAPSLALLVNAVPAVPVLLLGFLGLEGNEIVDHELSVPAVRLMLLSCAAHTGLTWGQLLLHERLGARAKAATRGGAMLGAVVFNYIEQPHRVTVLTTLCALAAVGAVSGLVTVTSRGQQQQQRPQAGQGQGAQQAAAALAQQPAEGESQA